ncbi:MAG: THUMP-like domain-containing protein [Planctomycetota bacterium]
MELSVARWLVSAEGQSACMAADGMLCAGVPAHTALDRMRKTLDPPHAAAAWDNALSRRKAVGRFPDPGRMAFVREALEQSTSLEVARHRAARFAGIGGILDWGAGLGADSLALAGHGSVLALERDPARAILHRHNTADAGVGTVVGDGRMVHPGIAHAAFADPDRRAGGWRLLGPNDASPPLDEILSRAPANLCVKLAPAAQAAPWETAGVSLEWISLGGELKEQVLWRGAFSRSHRQATVLPAGYFLAGTGNEVAPSGDPEGYLLDPDPAITCSGLAPRLALETGSAALPEGGGFLVARGPVASPFASTLEILSFVPLRLEKLRDELKARGAGHLEFRKRNSTADAEELRVRIKARGEEPLIVVLTRHDGREIAIVCRRIANGVRMG